MNPQCFGDTLKSGTPGQVHAMCVLGHAMAIGWPSGRRRGKLAPLGVNDSWWLLMTRKALESGELRIRADDLNISLFYPNESLTESLWLQLVQKTMIWMIWDAFILLPTCYAFVIPCWSSSYLILVILFLRGCHTPRATLPRGSWDLDSTTGPSDESVRAPALSAMEPHGAPGQIYGLCPGGWRVSETDIGNIWK